MDPQVFSQTQNGSAISPTSAEGNDTQARVVTSPDVAGVPGQEQGQAHQADAQDPGTVDSRQQPSEDAAQYRQRMQQLEQQNQQLQQTLGGVQQWAEQQQYQMRQQAAQQRYEQQLAQIEATANNMSPQDAIRYQRQATSQIVQELMASQEQIRREAAQQVEQSRRVLAAPLYIRHLVEEAKLPKEYEQRLAAFSNPEDAARQVPYLKQEYEDRKRLQEQIDQLARSTQASQIAGQAAGMAAGTLAPQNVDIPDNLSPREKAMAIYKQIKQGTYNR